jgi:hypothetical protein
VHSLWRNHIHIVFIDYVVKAKLKFGVLSEIAKRIRHWPIWIKNRDDVTYPSFAVSAELVDTADADPIRGEWVQRVRTKSEFALKPPPL